MLMDALISRGESSMRVKSEKRIEQSNRPSDRVREKKENCAGFGRQIFDHRAQKKTQHGGISG